MTIKIEFNDSEYRFSHGAAPRGRGSWAFLFPGAAEPWFTPGSTTFGEAKKLARIEAQRRFSHAATGATCIVQVCS